MTFTNEDAKDKGLVKAEASGDAKGVAQRQSPNIYNYFQEVCSDLGMDPGVVLVDMAVRALEDEAYRNQVMGTEVSLEQVKINQIREEDLDFVLGLQDKFADDDSGPSRVDEFIDRMIDNQLQSPMMDMGGSSNGDKSRSRREDREVRRRIDTLEHKIDDIHRGLTEDSGSSDVTEDTGSDVDSEDEREEQVRDLFSGSGEEEVEDVEVEVEDEEDEVEGHPEGPDVAVREDDKDEIPMTSQEGDSND